MGMQKIQRFARDHWKTGLLILIFLVAFQIRLSTADMKYIQAFDPFFHYRYTEYIVEGGVLPQWDELSYYPPGRPLNAPPLMYYVTAYAYMLFHAFSSGTSLFAFAKYMTAVYAALAIFPAYLIGKELSGKNAGLMAALFIGVSPAIMSRTMAGFYDTDTVVVFFSTLTMYLFTRLIRRVTLKDLMAKKREAWLEVVAATVGFSLFLLGWAPGQYIPIIAMGSLFVYAFIVALERKRSIGSVSSELVERIAPPAIAFVVGVAVVQMLGYPILQALASLIVFAKDPSRVLIVNISVAELQHTSIFGGNMGPLFAQVSAAVVFVLAGAILMLKRDRLMGSLLLSWVVLSLFTITQGVRFMLVFAPAAAVTAGVALGELYNDVAKLGRNAFLAALLFLVSVLVALKNPMAGMLLATLSSFVILSMSWNRKLLVYAVITSSFLLLLMAPRVWGWGLPPLWNVGVHVAVAVFAFVTKDSKETNISDYLPKALVAGTMLLAASVAISQGSQLAVASSSESLDGNWEAALTWLRDSTSADAVVGTWWDPGHQIAGFSGKRVIADGAHCPESDCKPGLNTRISDLGFIFSTSDEAAAVERLLKYRGDASEMYWIVSDDLVGKFQWLQYFGTGCDGSGGINPQDAGRCPLYSQLFAERVSYDPQTLKPSAYEYQSGVKLAFNEKGFPVVTMDRDGTVATFEREVVQTEGKPEIVTLTNSANNTLPGTVWVSSGYSYLVYIPPNQESSLFSRMFFYEDTFERFELVYKNNAMKIYKLKGLS